MIIKTLNIYTKHLPKNLIGITLFPFIILNYKHTDDMLDESFKILLNHEKIHIRQQIELLVLPFYIIYIIDYLIKYIKYKNANTAYMNIFFEREAYYNEYNLDYLNNRKLFNWKKYLKNN